MSIDTIGGQQLRESLSSLIESSKGGKLARKILPRGGRLIAKAQKDRAPVRQGRSARQKKFRSIGTVKNAQGKRVRPDGPLRLLEPGLLKRSLGGYRVRKRKDLWLVVTGANVGKKQGNKNFAPHRAIVGSGTKQRFAFRPKKGQIGPNKINRGVMPSNPYIMAGLQAASGAAINALKAGVQAEMNAALKSRLAASRES